MRNAAEVTMLPEHAANPFIAPLGPIPDYWANLDLFDRRLTFAATASCGCLTLTSRSIVRRN